MKSHTKPKSRRELLTDDIKTQVLTAIREELFSATSPLTDADHAAIEAEILSHTDLVLDALTTDEMQSEGARLSHIANARSDAQRLIRDRLLPSRPGGAVAVSGVKA